MGATRVYIVARQADHPSIDVMRILKELGHEVRSHMVAISDDVRKSVDAQLKKEDALKPKPAPKPKRAPRKPKKPTKKAAAAKKKAVETEKPP